MPTFDFIKSSYSGAEQTQECVEVARNVPTIVAIRDSKHPTGPALHVTPATWLTFTTNL
ncbi:DUF397 domain-containing protein [Streptomyces sp. NPDC093109]|uniref:DUF397 domain-containing protein n=1 Tax=Streptomyces sp. NPDC093109 TaxID=3154977 RepID=UPI00344F35FF